MFVKNACMLLIKLFSVPRAPLIARSAGPIVLDIAVPMLLIAATMAAQSIPNCALAGCGAISDTISTSTREPCSVLPKYVQKLPFRIHSDFPLLEQICRVLAELARHVRLALTDRIGVRQDRRLLAQFGRKHPLHRGLVLNRRYQAGAGEVCRRAGRCLRGFVLDDLRPPEASAGPLDPTPSGSSSVSMASASLISTRWRSPGWISDRRRERLERRPESLIELRKIRDRPVPHDHFERSWIRQASRCERSRCRWPRPIRGTAR